jgi:hypothetical protein
VVETQRPQDEELEEVEPKPQPEAESQQPETTKSSDDLPSGVAETVAKMEAGEPRELPERQESGATKRNIPPVHEQGPGDPGGPRARQPGEPG